MKYLYVENNIDEGIRTFTSLKELNRFKEGWYA